MLDSYHFRPVAPLCEADRDTDLQYFLEFDFFTTCGKCRQMDDLVNIVAEDISIEDVVKKSHPKRFKAKISRVKKEIRSILWNFYLCAHADYDLYLKISMRNEAFHADRDKNPFGLSRYIRIVLKLMEQHGWVKIHTGFCRIAGKLPKTSRIRQTVKAAAHIKNLPRNINSEQSIRQPVILKDRLEKKQISDPAMMASNEIQNASELIGRNNEQIRHHEITLAGCPDKFINYFYRKKLKRKKNNIDKNAVVQKKSDVGSKLVRLDKVQMSAIFHKAGHNTYFYGRMHGGFWQSIPSELRKCLLIDGQRCVELDYSSQILNIVASHHDVQLHDNAYVFDIGFPWLTPIQIKTVVKFAVLIGLGSKNKKSGYSGLRHKLIESSEIQSGDVPMKDRDLDLLYNMIFRKYPFLEAKMFQDNAMKLFFEDSELARSIIEVFLARHKPILPIHDGFVVKVEDEDLLMTAMRQAWEDRFKTEIQIKKEWGGQGFDYPTYSDVMMDRYRTLWPNFDDHIS